MDGKLDYSGGARAANNYHRSRNGEDFSGGAGEGHKFDVLFIGRPFECSTKRCTYARAPTAGEIDFQVWEKVKFDKCEFTDQ
jgi:hypothetical protein